MEKKALGKGLAALIGEKQAQTYKKPVSLFTKDTAPKSKGDILYLEINKIKAGQFQPRINFDDLKLQELISSVKEKGVLQPILVRQIGDGYEIIAGERRFRAATALGLDKIPAMIKDVKDEDALIISLVENIQRQELNPIEEAQAFQQLLEKFSLSQDDIAKALGKDKATVSNILRLLKLPSDIQQFLAKGDISLGHAKVLLATDNAAKQRDMCKLIISKSLSVRELENLVNTAIPERKRKTVVSKTQDPFVSSIEKSLQLSLGTKVRINAGKKRGKIIIEFYSPTDLERIVSLLKKK